jgi:type I restriction enzyme, S subunit
MAKDGKLTDIPRLRFPEFQAAGAWQRKKLSDLLIERKQRNRQLKYGPQDVLSVSREHGCVNQIEHLGRSYAGSSVKDYHVVETGDVVYTKSPLKQNPFGIIKENKGRPGIVSTLYAVYRVTNLGHSAYLDHYFSSDYNLNCYLQPIVRKGAKNDMKVNNAAVLGGDILIPSTEEQAKITDCLTSLDEVIAAQGRKMQSMKTHKRGLMQVLFPREGKTLPRLRFPEFRDTSGWDEKKAGSLFANRTERGEVGLPIYSVTMHDGMVKRSSFDRDFGDIQEPAGNKKAHKNDIAYNMMRMWQGALGVASEDCMVSPAYAVLAPQNDVVPRFFAYLFKLPTSLHLLTSHSRGLTKDRLRLYYDDFARITVRCPSEPEQQRIAECLLCLDAQIAAESKKLDDLKIHKAGLMQQLFQSPDGY